MTDNLDPTAGQPAENPTAQTPTPAEPQAAPAWVPPAVPAAAPAETVAISKRTLTIVGLLALAAVMLAGTFATGVAVGSHARAFAGRDGFGPRGPRAMMGDSRGMPPGAQGFTGQSGPEGLGRYEGGGQASPDGSGDGWHRGGRGRMRGQDQLPDGGQQAPDAQGRLQPPTVPGQ